MSEHKCAPAPHAPSSAPPGRALVVSRRASRCHTEAGLHLRTRDLRSRSPFTKSARDSNHQDQNVLTSRAACRSRPRQLAQIPMVVERRCHRGMNAELMLSHPRLHIHPYIHALCQLMHPSPSLNQLPTITPTTCLSSTTPFHTHHIPHPLSETRYESRETLNT